MVDPVSPVIMTPGEDPEMEQAGVKARQTFRYFWREVAWERRRIVPALDMTIVKAAFSDPPEVRAKNPEGLEVEFMWMTDIDFDGRQVTGTLVNSPMSLQSFSEGDQVKIPGKQICDWMYVRTGDTYGGFTIDLMRSRMSKSERKQHDQAWGFDFGEVGIIDLVPPEYLGEPRKKKGLFSLFSAATSTPQDYAAVSKLEHPMSVNMRESFDEMLTENPKALNETDDHGFTYLHQLALAGSWDGVDVCLKHNADPQKTAANGLTPFALAKSLSWKKVMARLEEAGTTK